MKLLFYLITLIPISLIRSVINIFTRLSFHSFSEIYKFTLRNIEISFPDMLESEKKILATQSFEETILSGYETLQSWSRPIHLSGKKYSELKTVFYLDKKLIIIMGWQLFPYITEVLTCY